MSSIGTKLDGNQVLKQVYDEPNNRLRVDATVSASIGNVTVVDPDGDTLEVNPNGSIDVNVISPLAIEIDAADGDNIAISDGVDTLAVNNDGSINVVVSSGSINSVVTATDLDIRNLTSVSDSVEVLQDTHDNLNLNANIQVNDTDVSNTNPVPISDAGSSLTVDAIDLDIRNLSHSTDNVRIGDGTTLTNVTANNELKVKDTDVETILQTIDSKLNTLGQKTSTQSVPVVIASDQSNLNISLADEPIKISGTENGQPNGTEFTFVNNLRLQILAAKDRIQNISYADFGTKNQRVTQIDYVAPSIGTGPGFTARKILAYTLVGNNYRRDSITWTII